jgi:chaperone BCS1
MPIEIFHLFSNPYFSAGFGLLGVGTGLAILRNSLKYASFYFKRKFLISLEIPSKDKSFNWVMEWMSSQTVKDTQHVSVETNFIQYENGEVATKTQLIPSPGTHYFQFKGYWIQVSRQREKNIVDFSSGSPWETLTFTTLGRNRKIFEELLSDAQRQALQREEGSTVIYTTSGGDWRRFGFPRKKKTTS